MERWSASLTAALEHRWGQVLLAFAFMVPAFATAGQYWTTGFWLQSTATTLLFWPGVQWHWGVKLPVWVGMGAMLAAYVVGIAWLVRRRTFAAVVLTAMGGILAANLVAAGVNLLTGWRELQVVASMELAGKANRAIFSFWHNPAWEELVFRGLPLVLLVAIERTKGRTPRWALSLYYLGPSLVFAWYHVPGHGPSRLVDTFILSLVFAWMTRRYTFFAPLVMHDIFDAMMTVSLGRMPNIPTAEVAWLASNWNALNSAWTVTLLLWLASLPVLVLVRRVRARRTEPALV